MGNKGVRNLFIFGSLFFFAIFVGMTFDTMQKLDKRAPEITEEVNQGKMAWHKYDCIGCHTIFGNGSYFAPDLTKTTTNKPAGYIEKFLVNPRKVKSGAAMPVLGITPEEARNLVVFLDWTSKVDTNGWPPKPVLASAAGPQAGGVQAYVKNGCSACHIINGVGGTSGPDLTGIGLKRDRQWLMGHFKNPAAYVPDSAMPSYGHLSGPELESLTDYMLSLR